MILLIDNYDSFSYNLYQLIGSLNPDARVIRNDEMTVADIVVLRPSHIVISPGPGRPANAGICEKLIAALAGRIPILGVCLGHQAVCEVFGATVAYAKTLMHGKSSMIKVDTGSPLFAGMSGIVQGARYHSLAALSNTIPVQLKVIATADDGEVMAVEHREHPVYGVQFHPESILTPQGKQILINFLGVHND
ncbi:MAG: aminodeoxychorismate/anthranilate synthase component II [Treponema sp.]|jgi:anthranilate synthase component 2|nr:aminodeoxychorismate/anthranilate synthase component II [Treponema sp.]